MSGQDAAVVVPLGTQHGANPYLVVGQYTDEIRYDKMIRFHALHDLQRYTVPRCWAPHTQTQMYGILAMMVRPYINLGTRPGRRC